jgi:hypothetical protein
MLVFNHMADACKPCKVCAEGFGALKCDTLCPEYISFAASGITWELVQAYW